MTQTEIPCEQLSEARCGNVSKRCRRIGRAPTGEMRPLASVSRLMTKEAGDSTSQPNARTMC